MATHAKRRKLGSKPPRRLGRKPSWWRSGKLHILPPDPKSHEWIALFGEKSIKEALRFLERLERRRIWRARESLCFSSTKVREINMQRVEEGFDFLTRHHVLPKSRGGGGSTTGNIMYMNFSRHAAWHRWGDLATISELICYLEGFVRGSSTSAKKRQKIQHLGRVAA